MIVPLLFFGSGATALVYEVLWSKYLALLLGSTIQAQTVVLAVFMGGLALGNRLFGKRADLMNQPLTAYGYLELIIGIFGFFFHQIYGVADWAFVKAGSPVFEQPGLLLGVKLAISAVLLFVPTVLMGGTLPLLAAWIHQQPGLDPARRVGIFYAINSLGAVTGAALGGLVLVQAYGMSASLQLTAMVNLLIAGLAILIGRSEGDRSFEAKPAEPNAPSPAKPMAARGAWLVATTGAVSMGLEVLASRSLALMVGGSLQAFAMVLVAFILGIGLGSMAVSSSRLSKYHPEKLLVALLALAGLLVGLYCILIQHWVILYSHLRYGLATNQVGYLWHQAMVAVIAILVLGLPAACLGAVLPLMIRLNGTSGAKLGEEVGRLLTCNTIGAVVGVLLTGFFLMPVLGLRNAFALISLGLLGLAGFRANQAGWRPVAGTVGLVAAAVFVGFLVTGENWRHLIGSGIFRLRGGVLTMAKAKEIKENRAILYYKDAADATVMIEKNLGADGQVMLRINGKTDASSFGDISTQLLLAHLPMMMKPEAKDAFVFGFGSGITAGALLGYPLERLTIAENCQPVLDAAHFFDPWNRGVLTNNRALIRKEDARTVLKLSPQLYDVIVAEPSNPWVAGIGSVFSEEFYKLASKRLKPGGVMAQWFHMYEMHDGIVFLIIRTFAAEFPYVEIWDTQEGDIVMLGSHEPWASNPSVYQKVYDIPAVRKDMESIGLANGVSVWARQMASQRTAWAIPGDGPKQSDEFPVLEYSAPEAFFMGSKAIRICFYDERSQQFPLADPQKTDALRSLPPSFPLTLLQNSSTSNPEIKRYFEAHALGKLGTLEALSPIAFRPPATYPATPPINPGASPEFRSLLQLEQNFLREPERWAEFADGVEKILLEMVEKKNLKPKDHYPTHYASLSARYALGNQDFPRAMRLLRLGFIFESEDEQLQFLTRALDRMVPPEVLKSLQQQTPKS